MFFHQLHGRFQAFTAVMIEVEMPWVVTPCSAVVGYQRFRAPCCLHLQGEVKMETARCSRTVVFNRGYAKTS
jgi:hypothetical protein